MFRPSKQVVLGQIHGESIELRLKMCDLKQVVNWFDGVTGQPILNVKNNKIVKNRS